MTRPYFLSVSLVTLLLSVNCVGQKGIPVIHASSTKIKILDGDDLQYGELVPSLKPDTYVVHPSSSGKTVVFYTNTDTISFFVKKSDAGNSEPYDFVVVLNNRDSCFQRIAFSNPAKVRYNTRLFPDTIHFNLGSDHFIHLQGKVNNSKPLDLIFDTGASLGVLSDGGRDKGAIQKEGKKNTFEIGDIRIEKAPIKYNDSHGSFSADGIVGYNVFEDKIVEIDYDKKTMIVHHQADQFRLSGYVAVPMIWRGSAIFIEALLTVNGKKRKALVLFDTGSKFSLSLNKSYCSANRLYNQMEEIGSRRGIMSSGQKIKSTTVLLPELSIGGFKLTNVPTDLENPFKGEGLPFNIMGNDVLKRFNVILDFQTGTIYLKPNGLTTMPYYKPFNKWYLVWIGAAVFLGGLFVSIRKLRRKSHSLSDLY